MAISVWTAAWMAAPAALATVDTSTAAASIAWTAAVAALPIAPPASPVPAPVPPGAASAADAPARAFPPQGFPVEEAYFPHVVQELYFGDKDARKGARVQEPIEFRLVA